MFDVKAVCQPRTDHPSPSLVCGHSAPPFPAQRGRRRVMPREAVEYRVVASRHRLQGEKNAPSVEARRNPRMRGPSERPADLAGKRGAASPPRARLAPEGFAACMAKVAPQWYTKKGRLVRVLRRL